MATRYPARWRTTAASKPHARAPTAQPLFWPGLESPRGSLPPTAVILLVNTVPTAVTAKHTESGQRGLGYHVTLVTSQATPGLRPLSDLERVARTLESGTDARPAAQRTSASGCWLTWKPETLPFKEMLPHKSLNTREVGMSATQSKSRLMRGIFCAEVCVGEQPAYGSF